MPATSAPAPDPATPRKDQGSSTGNPDTQGPASVSELAEPLAMSLAAVVQHVQVLEACGVVKTEKVGRTRMCRIERAAMTAAATEEDA
jgi:DNA-binding transcriptional ArsR family regulator